MTTRWTHWSPAIAASDAVTEAKVAARAAGHTVRTVARVTRCMDSCRMRRHPAGPVVTLVDLGGPLGWLVELVLR